MKWKLRKSPPASNFPVPKYLRDRSQERIGRKTMAYTFHKGRCWMNEVTVRMHLCMYGKKTFQICVLQREYIYTSILRVNDKFETDLVKYIH